jgi:hypothetical protein
MEISETAVMIGYGIGGEVDDAERRQQRSLKHQLHIEL